MKKFGQCVGQEVTGRSVVIWCWLAGVGLNHLLSRGQIIYCRRLNVDLHVESNTTVGVGTETDALTVMASTVMTLDILIELVEGVLCTDQVWSRPESDDMENFVVRHTQHSAWSPSLDFLAAVAASKKRKTVCDLRAASYMSVVVCSSIFVSAYQWLH